MTETTAPPIDTVIGSVIKLRDIIDAKKKAQAAEIAPLGSQLEKLENYLQSKLQELGLTSFNAKGVGTAFLQNVDSMTVADWDATLAFIKTNNAFELLERRVSKTVCREYLESNGALPPGVNMTSSIEVRVRRQ